MSAYADASEHVYIGQFTQPTFGIKTRLGGTIVDPDTNLARATLVRVSDTPDTTVFSNRICTRVELGVYEVALTSTDTSVIGEYMLTFTYTTSGTPQTFALPVQVGGASAYDELTDDLKRVVESVWHRFADLYDSPIGGPHLAVYAQTHFGRGRLAQLLEVGLGRLNTISQPFSTYTMTTFPVTNWGPILEQVTYVETIKHLMRSYVEQPTVAGASVTYLDRRDYLQRWQTIYGIEKADLDSQLSTFKMANMGLGVPGVLVSGGIYGTFGPVIGGASMAARPRYYYRFY